MSPSRSPRHESRQQPFRQLHDRSGRSAAVAAHGCARLIRHTKDLHKLIPADFVSNWNADGVRLAKPMGKTPVVDYWRWRFRRADR